MKKNLKKIDLDFRTKIKNFLKFLKISQKLAKTATAGKVQILA